MRYKRKDYSWVNEKYVEDVLHTLWRRDDNPKQLIIVTTDGDQETIKPIDSIKEWR